MNPRTIKTIMRREFGSYWNSPALYIISAVFLLVTGWFFFSPLFLAGRADLRAFFALIPLVLSFTVPALAMKSFAEEFKSGSFEMLGTLPVSKAEIVAGKYMAVASAVLVMVLPTILYPLIVGFFGDMDWGPIFGGYLGIIFLVLGFSALSMFASSFSDNQIIAFILGAAMLFFLVMIDKMIVLLPAASANLFQNLGADHHFSNFTRGIVDSRDLLYFISLTVLALQGTWLVVTERHK